MLVILSCSNALEPHLVTYSGTARRFQRDGAVYVPNFLQEDIFEDVQRECRSLRSKMKLEKDSIAQGRLGRVLDSKSRSASTFLAECVGLQLQTLLGLPSLEPSDFPLELRHYPIGSGMQWHQVALSTHE